MRPPRYAPAVLARALLSLAALIVLATARLPRPVLDGMARTAPSAAIAPGALTARLTLALLLVAALAATARRRAWR